MYIFILFLYCIALLLKYIYTSVKRWPSSVVKDGTADKALLGIATMFAQSRIQEDVAF